jgi:hypothetical protein
MKLTTLSLLVLSASGITAGFQRYSDNEQSILAPPTDDPELYTIEVNPGETLVVTEEQKWELKKAWLAISASDYCYY